MIKQNKHILCSCSDLMKSSILLLPDHLQSYNYNKSRLRFWNFSAIRLRNQLQPTENPLKWGKKNCWTDINFTVFLQYGGCFWCEVNFSFPYRLLGPEVTFHCMTKIMMPLFYSFTQTSYRLHGQIRMWSVEICRVWKKTPRVF